jgi:hypothetical protein
MVENDAVRSEALVVGMYVVRDEGDFCRSGFGLMILQLAEMYSGEGTVGTKFYPMPRAPYRSLNC